MERKIQTEMRGRHTYRERERERERELNQRQRKREGEKEILCTRIRGDSFTQTRLQNIS